MIFQEVGPNENLDVRRFSSAPFGLWEAGILKMGWVKPSAPNASKRRRHDSDFKAPERDPRWAPGSFLLIWPREHHVCSLVYAVHVDGVSRRTCKKVRQT